MKIELNVVTKRLVTCGGGRNTYTLFGTSDFEKSEFDKRMGGRLAQRDTEEAVEGQAKCHQDLTFPLLHGGFLGRVSYR